MKVHDNLKSLLENYTAEYLDAVFTRVDLNEWRENYAKCNTLKQTK
ncbi:hypothetical protein [Gelidibacter sp.]